MRFFWALLFSFGVLFSSPSELPKGFSKEELAKKHLIGTRIKKIKRSLFFNV